MARKKKLFSEETKRIDECQCIYCGHIFNGRNACNADMDRRFVDCPKCGKEMQVLLSIEYTCVPLED
jgi:NAD-dependent SIR2 family protein deacetylase